MALELCRDQESKKNFGILPSSLSKLNGKEITSLDLLTICNIFCVVSTQQRKKLTEPSEINPKISIDKPINREFKTLSGHHVISSGPILSHYDATMFSILVAIYIEKKGKGGLLICTYSDIAKKLKRSLNSGTVRDDINRSITRLKECNIKIYYSTQPLWMKSLILDFDTEGRKRSFKLFIQLNKWMVPQYEKGNYSVQHLDKLTALSGEYQPALYRLLTSSESKEIFLSIEEVYNFLSDFGVKQKKFSDLNSTQKSDFKYYLKKIVKKMIDKKAIDSSSSVETEGLFLKEITSLPHTKNIASMKEVISQ